MKPLGEYICARKYMHICGDGCTPGSENIRCPNYYPCHASLGGAVIESHDKAMILKQRLLEKLDEATLDK